MQGPGILHGESSPRAVMSLETYARVSEAKSQSFALNTCFEKLSSMAW